MHIYRTIEEIPARFAHAVVTVGNFDGVHLGHRAIFKKISQAAAERGGVSVVVTFTPHPLKVLAPERDFRLITTYAQKDLLIAESGIDVLISVPFSREFAALSAEHFVREILVGRIGMECFVIGFDYVFGRNREGNVDLLRRLGGELGFSVDVLEQVGNSETGFSSSMVRELISAGDVSRVVPLLGRYFSVGGEVVHGFHRGKQLGFPTANIEVEEELLPKPGVYAVKVEGDGWVCDGACNIGNNPTFYGLTETVEVHLLDFDADLYGSRLRVYFVERIRDEREYPDIFSLLEAIRSDVSSCRNILANVSLIRHHE
ncbi:MAG: bifunctional riboflavin kinase/FAD synthetase [Deltaproteobacteria bacterium]|nr:bifunctional riboflavin kinase/FAD synthetase [Deltaproteobacteria bacterium]